MRTRDFFIKIEGEVDARAVEWKVTTSKGQDAPTYSDFAEAAGMLLGVFFEKFQQEEEIGGSLEAQDFFKIFGLVLETARRVDMDKLGGWDFGSFEA